MGDVVHGRGQRCSWAWATLYVGVDNEQLSFFAWGGGMNEGGTQVIDKGTLHPLGSFRSLGNRTLNFIRPFAPRHYSKLSAPARLILLNPTSTPTTIFIKLSIRIPVERRQLRCAPLLRPAGLLDSQYHSLQTQTTRRYPLLDRGKAYPLQAEDHHH